VSGHAPVSGLPTAEAVNEHLAANGDLVPAVADHWAALAQGTEASDSPSPMDLPQVPDAASKHTGGDDAGYAA
jgi:hypothetical protein